MTKLLKNRVTQGLTQTIVDTYQLELSTARNKFVATPIIDDQESKSWETFGSVKRAEATETLKILRPCEAELPAHLPLTVVENGFSVYDYADAMITIHEDAIKDLKRLKRIGGATGFNMIKCIEEFIYLQADQNVEWAIGAKNHIEKLSRSTDKKSNGKSDKSDATTPKQLIK